MFSSWHLYRTRAIALLFFFYAITGFASDYSSFELIPKGKMDDTTYAGAIVNTYVKHYSGKEKPELNVAQPYLEEALNLFQKNNHFEGAADASFYLSSTSTAMNQLTRALEFSFISLKYAELSGNAAMTGRAYRGIGLIYYTQHRWSEAYRYFERAIGLLENTHDLARLNTAYYLSGLCLIELKQCEKARVPIMKARKISISQNDTPRFMECTMALGKAQVCRGDYGEAEKNLNFCQNYYESIHEFNALSSIFYEKSLIEYYRGNKQYALNLVQQAYEYDSRTYMHIFRLDITRHLARLHSEMHHISTALKYLEEYNNDRDSLISRDLLAELAVTQARYEFRKREADINAQLELNTTRKNRYYLLLIIAVICIIIGSIVFYTVRKERIKSDKLLLNILPRTTADELKKYGKAVPKNHSGVTIMFCDVESFTLISEQLSAADLVSMLNEYFTIFDHITDARDIEKIKTIGDAYMCVAGLRNEPNHAERVVLAACEMQKALHVSRQQFENRYGISLNFRIGIHTGPVASGVVGYKKYAYDIWGDSVNVAARMEQNSLPGRINISHTTYELIKDKFETEYRGELPTKNKGNMKMYFVIGPNDESAV